MPIVSIITQPSANALKAAYRPIVFVVRATRTDAQPKPPVVFCDVYINNVFYKSQPKSMYSKLNVSNSDWTFDVSDSIQEALRAIPAAYAGASVSEAALASCKVFCRFRSSGFDSNGFTTSEGTAPIQRTSSSAPTSGTGTESNSFYVVNSTLKHTDIQDLGVYLDRLKTGTWKPDVFPITARPAKYFIGRESNDFFRIFDKNKSCYAALTIHYRSIGQSGFQSKTADLPQPSCTSAITDINISQMGSTMMFGWTYSGSPEAFKYRINTGPWLTTNATSVTNGSLDPGTYNFEVVPFCNCTEGTGLSQEFTVVDVGSLCGAIITAVTGVQSSPGNITFNWTNSGSPVSYNYRIDGGSWINTTSKPLPVHGLTSGAHTIEIVPKCSNGSLGTGSGGEFFSSDTAAYSVTEFNSANGNHKIQRSFDDFKTAIHYRIFCSATLSHQGPFTATFASGDLISPLVSGTGPHCATALSDVTFTP
jgi:hypothetical protein